MIGIGTEADERFDGGGLAFVHRSGERGVPEGIGVKVGAGLGEELDGFDLAGGAGGMEGGVTVVGFEVHFGAAFEEEAGELGVAFAGGDDEGGAATFDGVDVRASLNEDFGGAFVAIANGEHEGSITFVGSGALDFGAALDEEFDHFDIATQCGMLEKCIQVGGG